MSKITNAPLDAKRIREASQRINAVINPTPLIEYRDLNNRLSGRVLLKPENLQRAGSFKIRGAYNALASMSVEARAGGVVAWSSGNHAQGVALAAKLFSIKATIVMPTDAPASKRDSVLRLGADIVSYDRYTEDREAIATALAERLSCPLVPSYDHYDVIAGQGTIGIELLHDSLLEGQSLDQLLICCGGGGLTAGISVAVHDEQPNTRIFAVEPAAADDTARSFVAGQRLSNPPETRSVCDALLTPTPGALTFPINQRHLTDVLCVTDDEVLYAVGYAFRALHMVLEPGGAVSLAALLFGKVDASGKTTVALLSGGNVSDEILQRALAIYDASE